jgi:hypothetical protein
VIRLELGDGAWLAHQGIEVWRLGDILFFLTNHCEATAPQQNFIQKQKVLCTKKKRDKGRKTYLHMKQDSKTES